jgi:outer membrane protein, heavy metal efflux system
MRLKKVDRMTSDPEKRATLGRPEQWHKAAALISSALLATLSLGCPAQLLGTRDPAQVAQEGQSPSFLAEETADPGSHNVTMRPSIQLAAHHEQDQSSSTKPEENGGQKEATAPAKKEGDDYGSKDASSQPKQKITLPMAIELCVNNNFRVLAGAERIRMAEADLITASLIPNPSLFADCQLIPLQHTDVHNQLGPPQWDTLLAVPIDWLLFGKRLAAMQAARLGIEVSSADSADVLRVQVARTVDAFYEVLEDDAYFKLAEKNLEELMELEKLTQELAKDKKVGALELDRIKLAVHEAVLERHDRELALDLAKARLRPFLGRTAADADYEVEGALTVTAVVPPPKLEEALTLAEAHRPDLLSGRNAIAQANAIVKLERRRAKPVVAIQPGWSYYDQAHMNGNRNGPMFDIGISTTLPITDRNQGNIRKAQSAVQERQLTYLGDRADVLADVEACLASYADAVEHLTYYNTPETLKAARDLRKDMEAAYRAGDRKLIELLDAQKAYRDRLGHVIEFESDYWRTLYKLNAAVGLRAYDQEKGPTQPLGKEAEKK